MSIKANKTVQVTLDFDSLDDVYQLLDELRGLKCLWKDDELAPLYQHGALADLWVSLTAIEQQERYKK
jgi:hypothetical protein